MLERQRTNNSFDRGTESEAFSSFSACSTGSVRSGSNAGIPSICSALKTAAVITLGRSKPLQDSSAFDEVAARLLSGTEEDAPHVRCRNSGPISTTLDENGPTLIENQLIREEVPIILPKVSVIVSVRKLPQIPRDGTIFIRVLLSMTSL